MPKSTKRKGTPSEQRNGHEVRSIDGLDFGHGDSEGPQQSAATLAASNEALQRLADIANFCKFSVTRDMAVVEEVYGTEMDRDMEIQRLNEALETLTHAKSDKMERVQRENEEFKAKEDALKLEKERYQKMQAELEARHEEAEAALEKDYERKLQEEKAKAMKQVKAKKAEIEVEIKQKFRDLKDTKEKLTAENNELKQQLTQAKKKLEEKKARFGRERQVLEQENKDLDLQLKQIKSEFPVERQSVQYYTERFKQISDAVRTVSSKYFQTLPERAINHPETVEDELNRLSSIFHPPPIWNSGISVFLRVMDAQHIISTSLCNYVWQPFLPESNIRENHQGVSHYLTKVSNALSATGGRKETVWRVLTLRGIDALGDYPTESSRQVDSCVQHILDTLQPLTVPSESSKLKQDLLTIVHEAAAVWTTARKDEDRILIDPSPPSNATSNANDTNNVIKWGSESVPASFEIPPTAKTVTTPIQKPLCIFPSISQRKSPDSETALVHQGSALFADSPVWSLALDEKQEQQELMEKAVLDARSKVYARRSSVPAGALASPTSPTTLTQLGGKGV
ncbi:MAG: hypothetical protein Q9217_000902 [Psora testacea]